MLRLSVRAEPGRGGAALGQARLEAERGDASWREWVTRAERGDAAAVRLTSRAEFLVGGDVRHVQVVNEGVWLERVGHVPQLEEQVRDVAYKDVGPLRSALCERGLDLEGDRIDDMYFHVELVPELVAALVDIWSGTPHAAR